MPKILLLTICSLLIKKSNQKIDILKPKQGLLREEGEIVLKLSKRKTSNAILRLIADVEIIPLLWNKKPTHVTFGLLPIK